MISPDLRRTPRRKTIATILGLAAASSLQLAPALAWGQDAATAEALFNKGVVDIKAGNYAEGCPAIAESQKLDPRPGTQFTLAECLSRAGKTASAFVEFEDFLRGVRALPSAQQSRYADRIKVAEEKKAELKPKIPELTIVRPKNAPLGLKIKRDGTEITGPMVGLSLPVDPGVHLVIVQVPGQPPTEQEISLSPGEHRTFEVVVPGPGTTGTGATDESNLPRSGGGQEKPGMGRTIGLVSAFGIGAAGLVMGGITGGLAVGDKQEVDGQCPAFKCSPKGLDALERGQTMANLSTVGFVIGGVGVATGVILLLTRPKSTKSTTSADVVLGPTNVALTIKGFF